MADDYRRPLSGPIGQARDSSQVAVTDPEGEGSALGHGRDSIAHFVLPPRVSSGDAD